MDFTAVKPGFAPEIPTMGNFEPQEDQRTAMERLMEMLRQKFMMGGATDLRNMGAAMGPLGMEMAAARAGQGAAQQMGRKGGMDAAEQMFDMSQPAPKMGQAGNVDPRMAGAMGGVGGGAALMPLLMKLMAEKSNQGIQFSPEIQNVVDTQMTPQGRRY